MSTFYAYLFGWVKEDENAYLTIISMAISTISELSELLESSFVFSGHIGVGWILVGDVGTLR